MRVGVVDIGTNSMRLLITDGVTEAGRWVEVTGLGIGVDERRALSHDAITRTIGVLARFGRLMGEHEVDRRLAVATSATRDAANREEFLSLASEALGVRPQVITGEKEGELAFKGATRGLDLSVEPVVSDIGGGSTEFVTVDGTLSIDIGSVRLTDRILGSRPASRAEVETARSHVLGLFDDMDIEAAEVVGVAGTWTSLGAIDLDLAAYDRERVHHHRLGSADLDHLVERLAALTVDETAAIPALDPARAPVILSGAVVATCVLQATGAGSALISEQDSLDGLAGELLGLP